MSCTLHSPQCQSVDCWIKLAGSCRQSGGTNPWLSLLRLWYDMDSHNWLTSALTTGNISTTCVFFQTVHCIGQFRMILDVLQRTPSPGMIQYHASRLPALPSGAVNCVNAPLWTCSLLMAVGLKAGFSIFKNAVTSHHYSHGISSWYFKKTNLYIKFKMNEHITWLFTLHIIDIWYELHN